MTTGMRTVPAREFFDGRPEAMRAKLLAVVKAVADAPPPQWTTISAREYKKVRTQDRMWSTS